MTVDKTTDRNVFVSLLTILVLCAFSLFLKEQYAAVIDEMTTVWVLIIISILVQNVYTRALCLLMVGFAVGLALDGVMGHSWENEIQWVIICLLSFVFYLFVIRKHKRSGK